MVERIQRFQEHSHLLSKKDIETAVKAINKTRMEVAIQEKKYRKLRTEKVPYAPNNKQKFGQEIRLWSLLIQRKGGRRVSTKIIEQQARQLYITNFQRWSQEAMKRFRLTTWTKHKKAKSNADSICAKFLENAHDSLKNAVTLVAHKNETNRATRTTTRVF